MHSLQACRVSTSRCGLTQRAVCLVISPSSMHTYMMSCQWFLERLGYDGLLDLLRAHADKSAVAQSTCAFCLGPGHDPVLFVGRANGTIVPPRGPLGFGKRRRSHSSQLQHTQTVSPILRPEATDTATATAACFRRRLGSYLPAGRLLRDVCGACRGCEERHLASVIGDCRLVPDHDPDPDRTVMDAACWIDDYAIGTGRPPS